MKLKREKRSKTFSIVQLGCPSNRADGNRIGQYLVDNSWLNVDINNANVIIVMTCGFSQMAREQSIEKIAEIIHKAKPNTNILLGGCLPKIDPSIIPKNQNIQLFSPRDYTVIDNLNDGLEQFDFYTPKKANSSITSLPQNHYLLRIATGCIYNCKFCNIKKATGYVKSRKIESIKNEILNINSKKYSIIHLVCEDPGSFGADINTTLFDLMRTLFSQKIQYNYILSSIHPNHFISNIEEYIHLFSNNQMVKRIGLPVQSGSQAILNSMKRNYSIREFTLTLNKFHNELPYVEISTDILLGYDGETDNDFQKTRTFLNSFPFTYVSLFKYDSIMNTDNKFPVSKQTVEERFKILSIDILINQIIIKGLTSKEKILSFLRDNDRMFTFNTNIKISDIIKGGME